MQKYHQVWIMQLETLLWLMCPNMYLVGWAESIDCQGQREKSPKTAFFRPTRLSSCQSQNDRYLISSYILFTKVISISPGDYLLQFWSLEIVQNLVICQVNYHFWRIGKTIRFQKVWDEAQYILVHKGLQSCRLIKLEHLFS